MAELLEFNMISESQLSHDLGTSTWLLCDCGHDCCTCNSECK